MARVAEITALLAKKSTFLQGVKTLTQVVGEVYSSASEEDRMLIFTACKRAYTLLSSRYTAVGFWRVGKDLFAAVASATGSAEPQRAKVAQEWLSRASEEVGAGDERSKGTEIESSGGSKQPQNNAEPPAPSASVHHNARAPDDFAERSPDAVRALLQRYVEDIDVEELLSFIQLHTDHSDSGPPPACREARFNLDVKTIKEKEVTCCVCQEEFELGGKAKMMPCGHPFHYDCLIEWLQRHNTCPTCRFTLPVEKPALDLASERVASRNVAGTQLYS